MTNAALRGKPDAGNPHVRFDEGEVASAATPRRGSLLYKKLWLAIAVATCTISANAATNRNASYVQHNALREIFKQVKGRLAIVNGDDSTGSGFVVEMEEGRKFFVTNRHVVECQKRITATLLNGKKLSLGTFEIATNRDLVRFALPDDIVGLQLNEEVPDIGEHIYIFGNSDGRGVATDLSGKIIGVGPENIEVSAAFVHGNSGSAVFDENGQVIGVATFATYDPDPKDWTKRNSRFGNVRRFAVRFAGVKWIQRNYQTFYNDCMAARQEKMKSGCAIPQVKATFFNPRIYSVLVPKNFLSAISGIWIKSDITLSLSGNTQAQSLKAPVVRVCVLVKSKEGVHMRDCILNHAGSMNGMPSPPVYSYGNEGSQRYNSNTDIGVYYLEGLSYWNGISPSNAKNIKFFDKKETSEALFCINKHMTGGKPPEILCFRFECWQNGALAGVYNSRTETALASKGIPSDWYIRGKYPDKFDYKNINFLVGDSLF